MIGISLRVDADRVVELVEGIQERITDTTPVMRLIGEIVRESVMSNFESGRSPQGMNWKPSRRAAKEGGMTLIDSAILRNSINYKAGPDRVTVGTPVEYAATHQFGAAAGSFGTVAARVKAHVRKLRSGKQYQVKAHVRRQRLPWGDIPARPFLGVREEDWPEIRESILDYALRRKL